MGVTTSENGSVDCRPANRRHVGCLLGSKINPRNALLTKLFTAFR